MRTENYLTQSARWPQSGRHILAQHNNDSVIVYQAYRPEIGSYAAARLQWDPDHDPAGAELQRRAVQLGIRGDTLKRYGSEEAISITDISDFVDEQRSAAIAPFSHLSTPVEEVYTPASETARRNLRLD